MPPVRLSRSSDDLPISNPRSGVRSSRAQEHELGKCPTAMVITEWEAYCPLMHDDPLKPVGWIQQLPHTTIYAVWLGVEWFGLEIPQ